MKSRLRNLGVFSLSAIDLFASAMGAFIIITIILMPDYQKEVRLEGHLAYIESLRGQTDALLNDSALGINSTFASLNSAMTRQIELQSEQQIMSAELEAIRAKLQARNDEAPPPPPSPVETEEELGSNLVTFRFLGLKTDKTRLLFMIDMNKYLAEHQTLVANTIARALASLKAATSLEFSAFSNWTPGRATIAVRRMVHWPR